MSKQESGHALNIASLEAIIHACNSMGPNYQPTKRSISLADMNSLLSTAQQSMHKVSLALAQYSHAVSARQSLFNDFSALSTRIIGALKATDAIPEKVRQAITFQRKIQGRRAKAIDKDTAAPAAAGGGDASSATPSVPTNISSSQQSYTQRIQQFYNLVELLKTEPSYAPSETELSPGSLNILYSNLEIANREVVMAYENLVASRIARNELLYADNIGIVDVVKNVKDYVRSVYSYSSPQYKQVNAIKVRMSTD